MITIVASNSLFALAKNHKEDKIMTVKLTNIIKMSNQIADNIGLHLDSDQAVDKVVNHIQLFWAKSMKHDLITYYQNDGNLLNEISQQATIRLVEIERENAK
ncbi:formate dehydrogenase subunit delta [Colwellia demingiae]|uniref:Formate dehydrogenase subunit delta n=1 Tax=Colwellia demingiae TaxID=89401 RepID=A0A5C6Q404_9GAMM|nr:formate dehydrogenase subunit delta [Colwellia demingiae]TWX63540.1 formate dehydrogenase subunit delta [Colwellia demingiae]